MSALLQSLRGLFHVHWWTNTRVNPYGIGVEQRCRCGLFRHHLFRHRRGVLDKPRWRVGQHPYPKEERNIMKEPEVRRSEPVRPAGWRPFRPEEVPLGMQFRLKTWPAKRRAMIMHVDDIRLTVCSGSWEFAEALAKGEISFDMGTTWLPCGTRENPSTSELR